MTKNNQLGKVLNKCMGKLSVAQIKGSMLTSFMVYKECVLREKATPESMWFDFHDLVALMWGYYGDLDLHIDKMEKRLNELISGFKTRSDIEAFVQSLGDYKEQYDDNVREIRKYFNCINV